MLPIPTNMLIPNTALSNDKPPTWIPDIFAFSFIMIELAKKTRDTGRYVGSKRCLNNHWHSEIEWEREDYEMKTIFRTNTQEFDGIKIKDCGIDVIQHKGRGKGYWFECRYTFGDDEDEEFLQVIAIMRPEKARQLIIEFTKEWLDRSKALEAGDED